MNAKKIIIAAVVAAFLIVIAVGLFLKIEDITITGNEWYTSEEIEEKIFDKNRFSRNTVYQLISQMTDKKEEIPFVEDYKIIFNSPKSVETIIYEKSIVGYVKYMGNYMYFDKDGIVVDSSDKPLEGIPEITGLKFGSIVLYKKLPVEDEKIFEDILNLTQILQTYGIRCDRIDYSGLREATLYLGDIKVVLGSGDLTGKIAELSDMLPKIRAKMAEEGIQGGTLYLDSYDENAGNAAYSFKRD
ncbi:MAG: cell division protein FtsQ [Lachnospiraceae bacterium]|nr:cell division protein FtsQ [Candidatus Darwinimomas equi]